MIFWWVRPILSLIFNVTTSFEWDELLQCQCLKLTYRGHSCFFMKIFANNFLTHIQKVKTHCVGLQLTVVAENHASSYCANSYRLHNWYNCPSKPCATTHPHGCLSLRKSRKSQTVHTALAFTANSSSAALLHSKVLICSLFKFTDLLNSGSWTSCKANHKACFQSCGFTVIVWKNVSQSTKWLYFLKIWGVHGPFGPPLATPMGRRVVLAVILPTLVVFLLKHASFHISRNKIDRLNDLITLREISL